MTGYLTTLVARLTEGAPGVRPRPVALFEPAAPLALTAWAAAVQPDAGEAEAEGTAREPGIELRPGPARVSAEGPRPAGRSAPRPSLPAGPPSGVETHESRAPGAPPERIGYLLPQAPVQTGQLAPELAPRPPAGPDIREPRRPVEPARQRPVRSRRTAPRATPVALQSPASPARPEVRTSPRPVRPEAASVPAWAPDARGRPSRGESSAAEPVISVTIGRVEVIAVPPAGPTSQVAGPERKSSVMSLEEYLSSREQEGRE